MRLPIQAPAVIREAYHWPAARFLQGLAPSRFSSAVISSVTCDQTVCSCGNGIYACCPDNNCYWDGAMCFCGIGGGR